MYSVVVPTFNRAEHLRSNLESLLAQETSLPYEIIVVDNNSADETRSVVRTLKERAQEKLRYVFEGKQGLSMAKNAGIAAAHGEVIAFVDDDTLVDCGWLEALAGVYRAHPDAWCVGGKIVLRLPETCPSWFNPLSETLVIFLGGLDWGNGTVNIEYPRVVLGGNFSVTRAAVSRVGLFNTGLGLVGSRRLVGEESDLCYRIHRAGGGVYYCGRALVIHLVPSSRMTKRFFRQRAYWQGRTDRISPLPTGQFSLVRTLSNEGMTMVKDWVKAWAYYCGGNSRRGFLHELAAVSRLGYLNQDLLLKRQTQTPAMFLEG